VISRNKHQRDAFGRTVAIMIAATLANAVPAAANPDPGSPSGGPAEPAPAISTASAPASDRGGSGARPAGTASFAGNPLQWPDAAVSRPYTARSLALEASGPDAGPRTFAMVSGPEWLSVAPDGALSGVPGRLDAGFNCWRISAGDAAATTRFALWIVTRPEPGINIDLNWGGSPTYSGTAVSADPGTVWNGIDGKRAHTGLALAGSDGTPTPVTWDNPAGMGWYQTEYPHFAPELRHDSIHTAPTWTLHRLLPRTDYTLYLLGGGHRNGRSGRWTFEGAFLQSGATTTFSSGGPPQDSWTMGNNYVVVPARSDAHGDLVFTTPDGNNFSGLQIEGRFTADSPDADPARSATGLLRARRWPAAKAREWHAATGPLAGCIYLPRRAVNSTAMWQEESFDPETIDEELGWAAAAGYNALRVFLQYVVWEQDPDGFSRRLDRFLDLAARHEMRVMPVLFDDRSMAGTDPRLGRQADPPSGVPDGGWVPSPGHRRVNDRLALPDLARYVKSLLARFGDDPRILAWDLYNQPGCSGQQRRSFALATAAFHWARETGPSQPLTATASGAADGLGPELETHLAGFCDVLSFASHAPPAAVEARIADLRRHGRPILCADWLDRPAGNRFETLLPLFAREGIGAFHSGLVAGRRQLFLAPDSHFGDLVPRAWPRASLHPNGKPYDPAEMQVLREFIENFATKPASSGEEGD